MANLIIEGGGIEVPAYFINEDGVSANGRIRFTYNGNNTDIYVNSSGQMIFDFDTPNYPTIFKTSIDIGTNSKGLYSRLTDNTRVAITSINSSDNMYFGRPDSESVGTVLRGKFVRLQTSSGVAIESDRNLKENINNLDEKYEKFFYDLEPVSYKYILGSGKRTHLGFIAQDVERALKNSELTNEDFAGICIDVPKYCQEEGDIYPDNYLIKQGNVDKMYSLIYDEFIALNTLMIQKQKEEIDSLKEKVNLLEKEIESLKEVLL